MKLKGLVILTSAVLLLNLCGCSSVDNITVNKDAVPKNYEASYKITAEGSTKELKYTNTYAIKEENGQLVISSKVDEPWNNGEEGANRLEGNQVMTTLSKINFTDNIGVPDYVEEEFYITADDSYYTKLTFEHDHEINAGILKTKKYAQNSETGFSEETYTLQLTKQYFDKDSLPFILGAFTEEDGVIKISSGNRSSLQAVKYEYMGNEEISLKAGTFDCKVIRLRPNTDFSVNSARIYIDTETNIPVKVVHDSSVMELISVNFN